jgi:hypothetical protein
MTINIAKMTKQQNEHNITSQVNANPYQPFKFLGHQYDSLHHLCIEKQVNYKTVKSRLENGFSLVDAVTQPRFTRSVEQDFRIIQLNSTGKWDAAEISLIVGIPVSRVKAVIKKYNSFVH